MSSHLAATLMNTFLAGKLTDLTDDIHTRSNNMQISHFRAPYVAAECLNIENIVYEQLCLIYIEEVSP